MSQVKSIISLLFIITVLTPDLAEGTIPPPPPPQQQSIFGGYGWGIGVKVDLGVVTPVGETENPNSNEALFSWGLAIGFELMADITRYLEVAPFVRFGLGEMIDTHFYEDMFHEQDLSALMFQVGLNGRVFLPLSETFRIYALLGIAYVSLGVDREEGTGVYYCDDYDCDEDTETVFSAGYDGVSFNFGLGARYDIPISADAYSATALSLYFEVTYEMNRWNAFGVEEYGRDVAEYSLEDMYLDHVWFLISGAFCMISK